MFAFNRKIIALLMCFAMLAPLFAACDKAEETDEESSSETVTENVEETEKQTQKEGISVDNVDFVITKDNKSRLKILCVKTASQKQVAAANDLKQYIKKMTGWDIPIVKTVLDDEGIFYIVVGENKITKELGYTNEKGYPGKESVTVSQKGNFLVLMGNDDGNYNGTQFAVNLILEKLGCGWFADDELWTIVPSLKKLELDVGNMYLNHVPQFSSRMTRVYSATPSLAHRWYQGGDIILTGHWLTQAVPVSEYAAHPEWFALVNGARDPNALSVDKQYWHFCYSNEELASRVADEVIKKFDNDPSLVSLTISANDGWENNWCECESCRSLGNVSDVMVNFANNVAKKVYDEHPNRRLQLYSYHSTFVPPQNTVKLHQMIELVLCRETNMYKPLDEDYMMPTGKDPISHIEFTQSWRENALEYIEKTSPTHVVAWDWYCISADREDWKNVPWVQGEVAIRNQQLYSKLGVEYVFYDHGPTDAYKEPNSTETYVLRWPLWYVAAKAAFDSSLDEEDILSDACNKLYGDASELMFEYFMLLSDISKDCDAYSNTWVPAAVNEVYGSSDRAEIMTLVNKILEKAESCSSDEKERINQQLAYWIG